MGLFLLPAMTLFITFFYFMHVGVIIPVLLVLLVAAVLLTVVALRRRNRRRGAKGSIKIKRCDK